MKKIIAVLLVLLLAATLLTACKESDETHNSDSTGAESTQSDTTATIGEDETTEESMNGDEFINDNEATSNDAWN